MGAGQESPSRGCTPWAGGLADAQRAPAPPFPRGTWSSVPSETPLSSPPPLHAAAKLDTQSWTCLSLSPRYTWHEQHPVVRNTPQSIAAGATPQSTHPQGSPPICNREKAPQYPAFTPAPNRTLGLDSDLGPVPDPALGEMRPGEKAQLPPKQRGTLSRDPKSSCIPADPTLGCRVTFHRHRGSLALQPPLSKQVPTGPPGSPLALALGSASVHASAPRHTPPPRLSRELE